MILIDHCERSVAGLMKVISSLQDVEAEPFLAMLSFTNIIYCIY